MVDRINTDIAILGSGPAGLAAALGVSALAVNFVCIGPAIRPATENPDTRTIALFQGSVEFLRNLGVWDDCEPHAIPLKAIRMVDDTRRLLQAPETLFQSSELGLDAFGYNIPNSVLCEKLYEALIRNAPGRYHATEAVTHLEQGEGSIIAHCHDGSLIETRLLIGADGKKSLSREFAGIKTRAWDYPQVATVCDFSHERGHDNISTEFHGPAGPCTTVPLEGNNSSIVLVETPDVAESLRELGDDEFARDLEKRLHGFLGKVSGIGKRAQFPLSGLSTRSFARNRVALVGESAHVIPPIGAQGLNLGLRDAAGLLDILIEHRDDGVDFGSEPVLSAYNKARSTDVWSRTAAIDVLNRSLIYSFLPAQVFRSVTFRLLNSIGPLRRFFMKQGMQPDFALPSLMKPGHEI